MEMNSQRDISFISLEIITSFYMSFFHLASALLCAHLSLVVVFVKRAVFYQESGEVLLVTYIGTAIWLQTCLFFSALIINKVGMIYIESEVLREGNN